MRIITDVEQGSKEWLEMRCGKITASRISDVLAKGSGATRSNYMTEKITELLTGKPTETYRSEYMKEGTQKEDAAMNLYSFVHDVEVEQVSFIEHSRYVGVSPDGLVGDDGLVEIKCPKSTTHTKYMISKKIPGNYYKQIQMQLWVSDRGWCDFVSYHPDFERQLIVTRIPKDMDLINKIIIEVDNFVVEMIAKATELGWSA